MRQEYAPASTCHSKVCNCRYEAELSAEWSCKKTRTHTHTMVFFLCLYLMSQDSITPPPAPPLHLLIKELLPHFEVNWNYLQKQQSPWQRTAPSQRRMNQPESSVNCPVRGPVFSFSIQTTGGLLDTRTLSNKQKWSAVFCSISSVAVCLGHSGKETKQ